MEKSKPDKPKWEVDEIGADILPIFVGILQCAGRTDFFVMYKVLSISSLSVIFSNDNSFISPAMKPHIAKRFMQMEMAETTLTTIDNLKLLAWYKTAQPYQPILLFLHGNAGHIVYRMPLIQQFIQAGFGVLLLEYRGYGGNPGSPDEFGHNDLWSAPDFEKRIVQFINSA